MKVRTIGTPSAPLSRIPLMTVDHRGQCAGLRQCLEIGRRLCLPEGASIAISSFKEYEINGPDRLWLADLTNIANVGGFVYLNPNRFEEEQGPLPSEIIRLKLSGLRAPLQFAANIERRLAVTALPRFPRSGSFPTHKASMVSSGQF